MQSGYKGVFKRYEKKYLLDEPTYHILLERLSRQMMPDEYGQSTICNLYFDTPNYRLIRHSIDGGVYKEKLRLRSYGVPRDDSTVFIEIKKKYQGVVYKRRIGLPLGQAKYYLSGNEIPERACQITKEIDWLRSYYEDIAPIMYISYDRTALYHVEDPDLRITFDSNICWRQEALDLSKGVWGNHLLEPGQRLMEIKIPGAFPVWLAYLLNELHIFPTSYSKYGRGYTESMCMSGRVWEELISA